MALVGKTVRLQDGLWDQVKAYAESNSLSLSEAISQLVARALRQPPCGEGLPPRGELARTDAGEDPDVVAVLKATVDDLRHRLDLCAETERELRVIVAGQSAALAAAAGSRPEGLEDVSVSDTSVVLVKKKKKSKKKKGSKKK